MTLPVEFVPYDPARHAAFVRDSWAKGAREERGTLERLLDEPGATCLVAQLRGQPDRFMGWAARTTEALVFAYVKPVLRRRGLCVALLMALGADRLADHGPVPVLYWTPSAEKCAAAGAPIYHAPYRRDDERKTA